MTLMRTYCLAMITFKLKSTSWRAKDLTCCHVLICLDTDQIFQTEPVQELAAMFKKHTQRLSPVIAHTQCLLVCSAACPRVQCWILTQAKCAVGVCVVQTDAHDAAHALMGLHTKWGSGVRGGVADRDFGRGRGRERTAMGGLHYMDKDSEGEDQDEGAEQDDGVGQRRAANVDPSGGKQVCLCVCLCVCACVCAGMHVCVCVCVRARASMCVCARVCIYAWVLLLMAVSAQQIFPGSCFERRKGHHMHRERVLTWQGQARDQEHTLAYIPIPSPACMRCRSRSRAIPCCLLAWRSLWRMRSWCLWRWVQLAGLVMAI